MIPEPTAEDLARDAESDYVTNEQDCFLELRAWIRLRVAAERERDEYIRQCHEAIALANEKRDETAKWFMAKCNAEAERDELRAWKESALSLLNQYSSLAATFPGKLGSGLFENMERGISELRAEVERLREQLEIEHEWRTKRQA